MKPLNILIAIALVFSGTTIQAQYPPFTKWYQNPLGFKPLNLHTANGIIVPAVAAAAVVIFTRKDSIQGKKWSVYQDLGVSFGYTGSKTTVYQHNSGVLYAVRNYLSLGAELSSYKVADEVNDTWGFGIRPFVRFYPVHNDNFKLYIQSGAGLMYFLDEFPQPSGFFGDDRMGTKLNGTPKYGLGIEFRLGKSLTGTASAWHVHVSNGDHPGYERNPGHDSNGFSLGLIFR